jgi:cell wall-associated NlpC family hydrolase
MKLLVDYATRFVTLPYRWGGDDTVHGFDCSGLVQEILASVGMDPPGDQTAQALFDRFSKSGMFLQAGKPGALCFYGKSKTEITHVGFGIDTLRMVEAGGGGSKTTSTEAAAEQNAYVRVRPIKQRTDLVAIVLPRYPLI